MEETKLYENKRQLPAFFSWWQGGIRYADNIDRNGDTLKLAFEKNVLYGDAIWSQLYPNIKLRPLTCMEIFGNNNPINLEIGIGNGEFIAKYASEKPEENWFGVEVFKKIFKLAEKRANKIETNNIRIIQFDAALILRLMEDESLSNVYVNFPDPWPKKKHKKRRLLKPEFMQLIVSKLKKGGLMQIATDHDDYAEEINENLKEVTGIESIYNTSFVRHVDDYFPTKYFRKFVSSEGAYFFRYKRV
ncbi:MAG: tRNA (guanosine(46)-N7)-methyltransferase TrmB [Mucispirillum sp.]|nr:tRNA (guanosine(46)-N7)-methyltransferase TrmB [Mucispirillum sp.]